MIEPLGELKSKYVYNIFKEQVEVLVGSGVDGIIIETMSDIKEAKSRICGKRCGSRNAYIGEYDF